MFFKKKSSARSNVDIEQQLAPDQVASGGSANSLNPSSESIKSNTHSSERLLSISSKSAQTNKTQNQCIELIDDPYGIGAAEREVFLKNKNKNVVILAKAETMDEDDDQDLDKQQYLQQEQTLLHNSNSNSNRNSNKGDKITKLINLSNNSNAKSSAHKTNTNSSDIDDNKNKKKKFDSLLSHEHNDNDELDNNNSNNSNNNNNNQKHQQQSSCCAMCLCRILINKSPILIPLLILSCMAAIYCIPFVDIDPKIPKRLPNIPFDFGSGPLKASNASHFKTEKLFYNQLYGPESIALDSHGNMYMAIEGGFILYAHLNSSSPTKRLLMYTSSSSSSPLNTLSDRQQYFPTNNRLFDQQQQPVESSNTWQPHLIKIAELNPIKLMLDSRDKRKHQATGEQNNHQLSHYYYDDATTTNQPQATTWRRECQLDEQVYGRNLWTNIKATDGEQQDFSNDQSKYYSKVIMSRCSKPLGVRLSPDESYLYVIDTLTGLYKIHLKNSERLGSNQRQVTRLIDFRAHKHHLLPVTFLDLAINSGSFIPGDAFADNELIHEPQSAQQSHQQQYQQQQQQQYRIRAYVNTTLMAVDDLVIDYGAGTRGSDIIYLSIASQNWIAVGFVYAYLEGRPSGAVLRYDTGTNQLSVMDPGQLAHVRTSMSGNELWNEPNPVSSSLNSGLEIHWVRELVNPNELKDEFNQTTSPNTITTPSTTITYVDRLDDQININNNNNNSSYLLIDTYGAPRFDQNDIFDDRALHFVNGLELTDDKQALLITDTANKRIIKHFIKGPRKGTSDLWAWTPNFPDNIRRGYDKNRETYWVAGCGEDESDKIDIMSWINNWPRLRKYILKNIYLFGWVIETFGADVMRSTRVRDFGYAIRTGHGLCKRMCVGMMILQYNANGQIIRSIHSKDFPDDLTYYSQVNEVHDHKTNQDFLYLSSPSYNYVTKLYLPPMDTKQRVPQQLPSSISKFGW